MSASSVPSVPSSVPSTVPSPVPSPKTKNAQTATNGNKAEALLCSQPSVKSALEGYFGKPIASIALLGGRKKADHRITFVDGTSVLTQNKNGHCDGRGHSVDRRKATLLTAHAGLHTLLDSVCIKKAGERPVVEGAVGAECVNLCLLGTDEATRPDYFMHTEMDPTNSHITHLALLPATAFLASVEADLFPAMDVKRTCVHLSPHLYFQRKGGGKTDHAPDDIQLKLRFSPKASRAIPHPTDLFALFTVLSLA